MIKASRRVLRTQDIEQITDPKERLIALNGALQTLHYGHNEVRRLLPLIVDALTQVVTHPVDRMRAKGKAESEPSS